MDDGIYRSLGDGIEVVADRSTIAPHSGTPFEDFRSFSYDSGAVAFTALAGGETAVYLHDGRRGGRVTAGGQEDDRVASQIISGRLMASQ